jgi:hypothetical protein
LTESVPAQKTVDSEEEFAGGEEWAALPNLNAMEEITLTKIPLGPRPDQLAQVAERPEVHLAKVVGKQILDSAVIVSVSQLLQMAPNLISFVQAQFNQVSATTSAAQGPVASGSSKETSSSSAEAVDAAAIDVDRQLPILPVTIGNGI